MRLICFFSSLIEITTSQHVAGSPFVTAAPLSKCMCTFLPNTTTHGDDDAAVNAAFLLPSLFFSGRKIRADFWGRADGWRRRRRRDFHI